MRHSQRPWRGALRVAAAETTAVLALTAAYLAYVFQLLGDDVWRSGLSGWGDPYFINALLEHWLQSALRLTDPASPSMYAPARGTLGYSVGLILYAPVYVVARLVLDPPGAHTATILLVMAGGAVSLYVLLRRTIGIGFLEAVLLTAFFVSSGNVVNGGTAVWSQMASVFLIPPILLLACAAARMAPGLLRHALAGLAGLLAALLLAQEFYTGLFALALAAVAGAVCLLAAREPPAADRLARVWRASPIVTRIAVATATLGGAWVLVLMATGGIVTELAGVRFSSHDLRRPGLLALAAVAVVLYRHRPSPHALVPAGEHRWVAAFGAGALLGCGAFLWIYVPAYAEYRGFPVEQIAHSLIPFRAARWPSWEAVRAYESLRALQLALAVGALACVPALGVETRVRRYGAWFLLLSVVVLLLPVRFGTFSLWQTFLAWLPGFSAIRDPKRIIYVYDLFVVLLAALFMARLRQRSPSRRLVAVLALGLLVTDWNREVFTFERATHEYHRWVRAPIAIDPECRSFFVAGASETYEARWPNKWQLYGIDATFVALEHGIPTLNGYSAWAPEGWGLANPSGPEYPEAVAEWIERHQMSGVCRFDIEQRTMTLAGGRRP